jgi:hypothetical protein
VIQDGVSSSTGISSKVLAEIVAHEFGHTLGFGHSTDGSALMYASVTGLGPSLRADDQTAARWLYPNGSGDDSASSATTATVPAAPTDLRALVSGGNIDLSWIDNASNETGHSVYLATGTGAFSKDRQTGANVSATRSAASRPAAIASTSWPQRGRRPPRTRTPPRRRSPPRRLPSFSMTPQTGTAGVTSFTFYDESTGGVTSRLWDFGDGGSSSALVEDAPSMRRQRAVHGHAHGDRRDGKSSSTSKTARTPSRRGERHQLDHAVPHARLRGHVRRRRRRHGLAHGAESLQRRLAGRERVSLIFLPTAGGNVMTRNLFLAPRQLMTYANALVDLFGIGGRRRARHRGVERRRERRPARQQPHLHDRLPRNVRPVRARRAVGRTREDALHHRHRRECEASARTSVS